MLEAIERTATGSTRKCLKLGMEIGNMREGFGLLGSADTKDVIMSQSKILVSVAIAVLIVGVIYYAIRPGDRAVQPEVPNANSPSADVPVNPDEALSRVVWLKPEDSQFNMRVLDCRPFCTTMISTTKNPRIVQTFSENRESSGEETVDKPRRMF